MLKEMIEKILSLAPPTKVQIEDRTYYNQPLIAVKEPIADEESVSTLTGFVDLLEFPINDYDKTECYVNVESHARVTLQENICDLWGKRHQHLVAELPSDMGKFSYGQYMGQEAFIVGLMSLFVDTADRNDLVKQVSSIAGRDVNLSEDDGVSQTVTVKSGMALMSTETVKRIVSLAPYRTFREIEQPASPFIFRVKKTDDGPMLALFEADGGKWRLDAVQAIKTWLSQKVKGIAIVA